MGQLSRNDLITNLTSLFADNTTGEITPEKLREFCQNIVDSAVLILSDTNKQGLQTFDATRDYVTGEVTVYDGVFYTANTDISAGAFDSADWDLLTAGGVVYQKTVEIETADILTLNSTPIELIPAATGKKIQILSATLEAVMTIGMATYTTNTTLAIYTDGSDLAQIIDDRILVSSDSRLLIATPFIPPSPGGGDTQLVESQPVMCTVNTGDPDDGEFDIKIHLTYVLI